MPGPLLNPKMRWNQKNTNKKNNKNYDMARELIHHGTIAFSLRPLLLRPSSYVLLARLDRAKSLVCRVDKQLPPSQVVLSSRPDRKLGNFGSYLPARRC